MAGNRSPEATDYPEFVFFNSETDNGIIRDVFEPIAREAEDRGYNTRFTSDFGMEPEIGFYCEHQKILPEMNAETSFVMFHGVDDSFDPEYFVLENWNQYDVGLLPGKVAAETWQGISWHDNAVPKGGVYNVGWPKADHIFTDEFENKTQKIRDRLKLYDDLCILYAPTLESDDKVIDFIEATKTVSGKKLIKSAPYDDVDYSTIPEIEENTEYKLLNSSTDIMITLSVADIVVSDESSVLLEGMLTETIPVSVTDWPIRWGNSVSYPGKKVPTETVKTKRKDLTNTLEEIINHQSKYRESILESRDDYFNNLGESSEALVDVAEKVIHGEKESLDPVQRRKLSWRPNYEIIRRDILHSIPERRQNQLSKLRAGAILRVFDKIFK